MTPGLDLFGIKPRRNQPLHHFPLRCFELFAENKRLGHEVFRCTHAS